MKFIQFLDSLLKLSQQKLGEICSCLKVCSRWEKWQFFCYWKQETSQAPEFKHSSELYHYFPHCFKNKSRITGRLQDALKFQAIHSTAAGATWEKLIEGLESWRLMADLPLIAARCPWSDGQKQVCLVEVIFQQMSPLLVWVLKFSQTLLLRGTANTALVTLCHPYWRGIEVIFLHALVCIRSWAVVFWFCLWILVGFCCCSCVLREHT